MEEIHMKYLIKRTLSGLLVILMLLSSCDFAFAFEADDYTSGHVSGAVINEGNRPADVINLVMPTTRDGMFDFWIDPMGTLKNTGAKRYLSSWGVDSVNFGSGNLFFRNVETDANGNITSVNLTKNSDFLKIINKSSSAVDIKLSFDVTTDKDIYNFTFADNPNFLDANQKPIRTPAMYLALMAGRRSGPVKTVEKDGESVNAGSINAWLPSPGDECFETVWNGSQYVYHLKDSAPESAFPQINFRMTGAINTESANWSNASRLDMALNVTWEISRKEVSQLSEDPYAEDFDPLVTIRSGAQKVGDEVVLELDYGEGAGVLTNIERIVYTSSDDTPAVFQNYTLDGAGLLISFTATEELLNGNNWAVRFSDGADRTYDAAFNLKAIVDPVDPSVTVDIKATETDGTAVLTVDWGAGYKAMTTITQVNYKTASGDDAIISADKIVIDGSIVRITIENEALKGSEFMLMFTNEMEDTFELAADLAIPPDEDPSVTVVTQVQAAKEWAVLNINWGSGAKAMTTVTNVSYKKADGSAGTISGTNIEVDGATIRVKVTATPLAGSDFKLVLANEADGSVEIPVDIVNIPKPEVPAKDPSITNVKPATVSGGSAVVTVDWGAGSKAMTTVSQVSYTKKTGALGVISASSITVSGNTVTIKIAAAPFAGSDFKLVFGNDSGGSYEISADLVKAPDSEEPTPSGGKSPNITISKAASAKGDLVDLALDLGGNTDLKLKEMLYVMSGASSDTSVTEGSNLTVSSNKVTVKVTTPVLNGSNWRLVLQNDAESKTVVIPFNLKTTGTTYGVTVIVTTPAVSKGDFAVLSLNTANSAYTTVKEMQYVMTGTVVFTPVSVGSNLVISDDGTVKVKATTPVLNGSNWKIVLSDGGSNTLEVPFKLK